MQDSTYLFEKEKIGVALVRLAAPSIMVSVITLVYDLINSFFVGRLDNTAMIASITISVTLSLLITTVGEAVGIGAASHLGRQLGAKKGEEASEIIKTALTFNILISGVLMVIMQFALKPYIAWQTTDLMIAEYAYTYGVVLIAGSIFTSFYTTCVHLFRSVGDVKFPMYMMGISVAINIILDPFLMFDFGLGLGVVGAAIASFISQISSTIMCLIHLMRSKTIVRWMPYQLGINLKIVKEITSVGFAVYIRNMMSSVSMAVFTKVILQYGSDYAAGCNVGKTAMYFINFFISGVANGYLPLAAYNYGAKNYQRLWSAIKFNLQALSAYAVVAVVFMTFNAELFISIFTTSEVAIAYGAKYLRAYNWSLLIYSVYYIFTVTLQAAGKGKESMILSLARQGLIYVPLLIIMSTLFKGEGVFYAQPLSDWLTVITAIIISRKLIIEIYQGRKNSIA